jgi:hypothetical protein
MLADSNRPGRQDYSEYAELFRRRPSDFSGRIDQLLQMGYARDQCIEVLYLGEFQLENAIQLLTDGQLRKEAVMAFMRGLRIEFQRTRRPVMEMRERTPSGVPNARGQMIAREIAQRHRMSPQQIQRFLVEQAGGDWERLAALLL